MADAPKNPILTWWRTFNCFPQEYNRAVHGPYDPRTNYATKDPHITQVKLGELPGWIMRRKFGIRAIAGALNRHRYRTFHHHVMSVRGKSNIFWIIVMNTAIMGYVLQFHTLRHHRRHKYHW